MMLLIARIIVHNFHTGKMTRWQLAQNVVAPSPTFQTNFKHTYLTLIDEIVGLVVPGWQKVPSSKGKLLTPSNVSWLWHNKDSDTSV